MVLVLGRPSEFREAKEDPGDVAASLLLVLFKSILITATWAVLLEENKILGPSILFNRHGDMMMTMRRRMMMTIKTNLGLCILGSCEGDIRAARRCSGFSSPLRVYFVTLLLCYFSFFIVIVYHCKSHL